MSGINEIGRKVYFELNGVLMAVEAYQISAEKLKELKGIDVSGGKLHLCSLSDVLGCIMEFDIGESSLNTGGVPMKSVQDILPHARKIMVSQSERENSNRHVLSGLARQLVSPKEAQLSERQLDAFKCVFSHKEDRKLLGMMEVPLPSDYQGKEIDNAFVAISYVSRKTGRAWVPVIMFYDEKFRFDEEVCTEEGIKARPWIAFYVARELGRCYGMRFESKEALLKSACKVEAGSQRLCWML